MKSAGETFKDGLEISFLIIIFSTLNFEFCFSACARAEYDIDGECCPMCPPGSRVYRDCTEFSSTTCVPCLSATFLDAPNGLKECFSCTVCDPFQGLRVHTACTVSSDTVCEPLDGHYCANEYKGNCIHALKHSNCKPEQYIKKLGTAKTDTECATCAEGTFSNGSVQICQEHRRCEDLGLLEINPGTLSSDTECGPQPSVSLILGIVFVILLLAVAAAVFIFLKITKRQLPSCSGCTLLSPRNDNKRPEQETEPKTDSLKLTQPERSHDSDPVTALRIPEEASDVEDELSNP